MSCQDRRGRRRRVCRLWTMAKPVEQRDEGTAWKGSHDVQVAGAIQECAARPRPFDRRRGLRGYRSHFFMVIVVPWPTVDTRSNSSITRFVPGRPTPRLLTLE